MAENIVRSRIVPSACRSHRLSDDFVEVRIDRLQKADQVNRKSCEIASCPENPRTRMLSAPRGCVDFQRRAACEYAVAIDLPSVAWNATHLNLIDNEKAGPRALRRLFCFSIFHPPSILQRLPMSSLFVCNEFGTDISSCFLIGRVRVKLV